MLHPPTPEMRHPGVTSPRALRAPEDARLCLLEPGLGSSAPRFPASPTRPGGMWLQGGPEEVRCLGARWVTCGSHTSRAVCPRVGAGGGSRRKGAGSPGRGKDALWGRPPRSRTWGWARQWCWGCSGDQVPPSRAGAASAVAHTPSCSEPPPPGRAAFWRLGPQRWETWAPGAAASRTRQTPPGLGPTRGGSPVSLSARHHCHPCQCPQVTTVSALQPHRAGPCRQNQDPSRRPRSAPPSPQEDPPGTGPTSPATAGGTLRLGR